MVKITTVNEETNKLPNPYHDPKGSRFKLHFGVRPDSISSCIPEIGRVCVCVAGYEREYSGGGMGGGKM